MFAHSILRKPFQNINLVNLYFQYSEHHAPVQKPRRENRVESEGEGEKVDELNIFDIRMNTVTFTIMYIHVGSLTIHIIIIVFPDDKSTIFLTALNFVSDTFHILFPLELHLFSLYLNMRNVIDL